MIFEKFKAEYKTLANDFHCGNIAIDNFLQSDDALDINQGITYILLTDEKNFIIGYYNISVGRIDRMETIGDEVYYLPMGGTVNINYLAIDERLQHTQVIDGSKIYFGDYILRECEKRILKLREDIGIAFVTLYSTEEGYHMYHDRNSYEDFEEDMSTFVEESNKLCYKLYKWVDDILE